MRPDLSYWSEWSFHDPRPDDASDAVIVWKGKWRKLRKNPKRVGQFAGLTLPMTEKLEAGVQDVERKVPDTRTVYIYWSRKSAEMILYAKGMGNGFWLVRLGTYPRYPNESVSIRRAFAE